MKKPNFFIIGAPKCGTTSLTAWLAEHPNIFMCPGKEPHFFNTDLKHRNTYSWRAYQALFRAANDIHIAVGEASVYYLFSQVAVPNIEREIPNARYIVMLRNPVEMAYSLHGQRLFSGNEHIADFEEAWRLSPQRREGRMVTRLCREPKLSDYQSVCRLGEQLERLLRIVPRDRVLALILDDVKANPRREYLRVLEFLGVPDDGRTEFPVKNPAKEVRWPGGHNVILIAARASMGVKRLLGISGARKTGVLAMIDKVNRRCRPRPPMSAELRATLTDYFREDILLLACLLNRDLSAWLAPGEDTVVEV